MPGIDEETLEVGAGEGIATGGGADLDDLEDGPSGTGGSLVVEDEEDPYEDSNGSGGSNNTNDSLNAISQSVWYEKVYEDEENAETASHLVM